MNDTSREKILLIEDRDAVRILSLNRPHRHNAINMALHDALVAELARAEAAPHVRAILLKGEGRSFCSGGDVTDMDPSNSPGAVPTASELSLSLSVGKVLLESLLAVTKPVVSAVHGNVIGQGATLALFCDVVVAAEDAVIADTHVNVGLVAGDGGAVMWPLLMSFAEAKYYLLTGDRLSGRKAKEMGLVHAAVPFDEVVPQALALAERLAAMAPIAIAGTKATLNRIVKERMASVLEFGLLYEGASVISEDHREGVAAWRDKRDPHYVGR